jgi:hypothetical protein
MGSANAGTALANPKLMFPPRCEWVNVTNSHGEYLGFPHMHALFVETAAPARRGCKSLTNSSPEDHPFRLGCDEPFSTSLMQVCTEKTMPYYRF